MEKKNSNVELIKEDKPRQVLCSVLVWLLLISRKSTQKVSIGHQLLLSRIFFLIRVITIFCEYQSTLEGLYCVMSFFSVAISPLISLDAPCLVVDSTWILLSVKAFEWIIRWANERIGNEWIFWEEYPTQKECGGSKALWFTFTIPAPLFKKSQVISLIDFLNGTLSPRSVTSSITRTLALITFLFMVSSFFRL